MKRWRKTKQEHIIDMKNLPSLDKLVEEGCETKYMMFVSSFPQHYTVTGVRTAHGVIPLTYQHSEEVSQIRLLTNVYPKSLKDRFSL